MMKGEFGHTNECLFFSILRADLNTRDSLCREVHDLGNEAIGGVMDYTQEKSYVSESKTPCEIWSLRAVCYC